MIIYVNGDSHSAGAEAVNSFAFAEDDALYQDLGRQPHPDNLQASYGRVLADTLDAVLYCDAESASSNNRILRTTRDYIKSNTPDLIIIGWSTWEREEVVIDNRVYQFSAGCDGQDWTTNVKDRYKEWARSAEPNDKMHIWHNLIFQLHEELTAKSIPHLFFNTLHSFDTAQVRPVDWHGCYLDAYTDTYTNWLLANGQTTLPNSYHFGADAHKLWADRLTKYLYDSKIVK